MASKDGIGNQHEIDDFLNKVDEIGNFIYEQYIRFTSRIGWMSVFLGGVFRLFYPWPWPWRHVFKSKSQI